MAWGMSSKVIFDSHLIVLQQLIIMMISDEARCGIENLTPSYVGIVEHSL